MSTGNLRGKMNRFWYSALVILILVFSGSVFEPVQAEVAAGYSEYYISGHAEQLWNIFVNLDNDPVLVVSAGLHNVVGVTASTDGTVIYYDHWENGYSFDPNNPETTYDERYTLNQGGVKEFESRNIPVAPRGTGLNVCENNGVAPAAEPCYDGRDRLYVSGGASTVTQAAWPESIGTVFALAWEVFPTKPYLTSYIIPVGENLAGSPYLYDDFASTYVIVQSTEDGNLVEIDDPSTAGVDVSVTLNRGEVTQLWHIDTGTTVTAAAPVQTQFIVGQAHGGTASESRGFTLVPQSLWDSAYYAPVGGFGGAGNTDIYLYNPNAADITVTSQDSLGTASFTVPAGGAQAYSAGVGRTVPQNSAVYLSADQIFWAIGSADTEDYNYDWGYSLVPDRILTSEYYLGWAPGSSEAVPTVNGSPAWITPVENDTTVYVDYSPVDGIPDLVQVLDRIQILKVYDPDNDNTGMHIWATGNIAVAWGEDGTTAAVGTPYLDIGYTTLPLLDDFLDVVLSVQKTADPAVVSSGAGHVSAFTLVTTTDQFSVDNVVVVDTLPADWAYVAGNTTIRLPDNSLITGVAADPIINGQDLTWDNFGAGPLDMGIAETLTIEFQAVTTGTPVLGYSFNTVTSSGSRVGGGQTFTATDIAAVYVSQLAISKTSSGGGQVSPGDQIVYTIVIDNDGVSEETSIAVEDILPPGTSYVAGSTLVTAPAGGATETYLDQFETASYSNSNGSTLWSSSWVEGGTESGNSPTTGQIRITGGELIFDGSSDTSTFSLSRAADLSGTNSTILSFTYREGGNLEVADTMVVSVYDGSTWHTVLSLSNDFGGPLTFSQDISAWANANTQIRFQATGFAGNNELFAVDNVQFAFTTPRSTATFAGSPPPALVSGADGYTLMPGESLTVEFRVTVDDPPPTGLGVIVNTAGVTSDNQPVPLEDTVTDWLPAGAIGNFVWMDQNGDGVQNAGEAAISGVVVNLFDPGPDGVVGTWDDVFVMSAQTDETGQYNFANVTPGDYYVEVELPTGYSFTIQSAGSNQTLDSDVNPASGQSGIFVLSSGETNVDIDAGFAESLLDYGDLPANYAATLLMDDGARHLVGTLTLGSSSDFDPDGQESVSAAGDDGDSDGNDDDGVGLDPATRWSNGDMVNIQINVGGTTDSGTGDLGVWIDWNGDGTFDPSTDFFSFSGLATGTATTVSLVVPDSTIYTVGSYLNVRTRIFDPSSLPGGSLDAADYLGLAVNGEVEDYRWTFTPTSVTLVNLSATTNTWQMLIWAVAGLLIMLGWIGVSKRLAEVKKNV